MTCRRRRGGHERKDGIVSITIGILSVLGGCGILPRFDFLMTHPNFVFSVASESKANQTKGLSNFDLPEGSFPSVFADGNLIKSALLHVRGSYSQNILFRF